ncbi:MAG: SDR family oxidoreductase [Treponemataceae bacterium]|nr:SDR family oxidoreductase [Treponemataceae bacterium]
MNLSNKIIVITGAGGVICSGIATELAKYGAKVALLNRTLEKAQTVADKINADGETLANKGCAKAYHVNVVDKASIESAHEQVLKDFGKCDILINGAGGNNPAATTSNETFVPGETYETDFFSLQEEGVRSVFDLNFLGTFLPTQVFAQDMIGRKGCSILNISSMNAFTPLTKIPAYSAAKSAVSNFTEWLAVHFAPSGIRVNAIAPGFFVTDQNKSLLFNPDGSPSPRTKKILAATPMNRFGKIEELMGAVKLLVSEENAGFITGVVLPIDGGFNAYSGV